MLFARLSVFAGGWTLAAAEAVVAGEGLASNQVLDELDRLVAKSLVVTIEGGDRYRMLETIREYARGNLQASGDEEAVQARHHAYFLAFSGGSRTVPAQPHRRGAMAAAAGFGT